MRKCPTDPERKPIQFITKWSHCLPATGGVSGLSHTPPTQHPSPGSRHRELLCEGRTRSRTSQLPRGQATSVLLRGRECCIGDALFLWAGKDRPSDTVPPLPTSLPPLLGSFRTFTNRSPPTWGTAYCVSKMAVPPPVPGGSPAAVQGARFGPCLTEGFCGFRVEHLQGR